MAVTGGVAAVVIAKPSLAPTTKAVVAPLVKSGLAPTLSMVSVNGLRRGARSRSSAVNWQRIGAGRAGVRRAGQAGRAVAVVGEGDAGGQRADERQVAGAGAAARRHREGAGRADDERRRRCRW